ncbi:MAG: 50S ribosomal protein L18e [Halobacteria archaeon]|nr:50S ribosomal protein L18e [Halobacteria archaeon]
MSKQNPRLVNLIEDLKERAREDDVAVWDEVASRLESPRRTHAEVNLSRIERYAKEDETVVVPGKVLGDGVLSKEVKVAAFDFSSSARRKISRAKGEPVLLEDLIEENPDGSDVRIIR